MLLGMLKTFKILRFANPKAVLKKWTTMPVVMVFELIIVFELIRRTVKLVLAAQGVQVTPVE